MAYYKTGSPVIAIKYDEDSVDLLRKFSQINVKDALNEIDTRCRDCNYSPDRTWFGYILGYQWSTGLDFEDHVGGGYILSIETDYYPFEEIVQCYVEWDDDWVIENELEEQCCSGDNVKHVLEIALNELNKFLASI